MYEVSELCYALQYVLILITIIYFLYNYIIFLLSFLFSYVKMTQEPRYLLGTLTGRLKKVLTLAYLKKN